MVSSPTARSVLPTMLSFRPPEQNIRDLLVFYPSTGQLLLTDLQLRKVVTKTNLSIPTEPVSGIGYLLHKHGQAPQTGSEQQAIMLSRKCYWELASPTNAMAYAQKLAQVVKAVHASNNG